MIFMNNDLQTENDGVLNVNNEGVKRFLMQAPAAIAVVKWPDAVISLANGLCLELVGRTEEQTVGKDIRSVFPEAALQGVFEILEQVYTTGQPFKARDYATGLNINGVLVNRYFDFTAQPIKDNAGLVAEIMIHLADVTERVEAYKKSERSEQQLILLANAMPQVVWIAEPDGTLIYCNDRILDFEGGGKDKLGNWDWKVFMHEADIERTANAWLHALKTRQPYQVEHRLVKKDGSLRWHLSRAIPDKNEAGEVNRWYGTATDIHEQKTFTQKLEEKVAERTGQLQSERDFIETILNASNDMIAVFDSNMHYLKGNLKMQQQYGLKPEDFIGKHLLEVFPKMKDSEFMQAIEKGLQGETTLLQTYKSLLVNRWYQNFFVPLKDGEKVYGVVVVGHDITDVMDATGQTVAANQRLEEKNEELLRTNKELESFTYIASHDLQEPLRKIQMFIQLLNKNKHDETQREKYIEKINSSAQRMSQLIDAILDYSRISGTKEKLELIDLNETLSLVKNDFEMLVEEKKAVINSTTLPVIEGVGVQLSQLFSNLLSNALKFASQNPVIHISARVVKGNQLAGKNLKPEADYMELKFADNGIGFEPQFAERIFQLFQRLHGKSEYAGTGVGLSIVKKIAERHQGYIYAQSEPGVGATFVVVLPLKQG
jgi:PAS domain S-box-containing protein